MVAQEKGHHIVLNILVNSYCFCLQPSQHDSLLRDNQKQGVAASCFDCNYTYS